MSFDVWLENRTPFDAQTHVQTDADGQELLVVMMSASFEALEQNETLTPAKQQTPVCFADEPFGDPALSSNRYEADIAPVKPQAEIVLNATAYAPNGIAAPNVTVGIQVGTGRKLLNIVGDRLWSHGGFSAPNSFHSMPITYERAFGGTNETGHAHPENPVGIGFREANSAHSDAKSDAPNVLYAGDTFDEISDTPRPAGFGAIGRGWQPRIGFAGTYDQEWLDKQWPLPPHDYDPRHNMCAPLDQQLGELKAGMKISLANLTPTGEWRFKVPQLTAPVHLIYEDRIEETKFEPDTLLIEPDMWRITLKARIAIRTRRNAPRLREVVFGNVSPVWLSARRKNKKYINLLGGDGTLTDLPTWLP